MEKSSDKYTPPTEKEVLDAVFSDGYFAAKCRVCKQIIKAKNLPELMSHKCPEK